MHKIIDHQSGHHANLRRIAMSVAKVLKDRFGFISIQSLYILHVMKSLPPSTLKTLPEIAKEAPLNDPIIQSFIMMSFQHITFFWRHSQTLHEIKNVIIPRILEGDDGTREINIWSAGCSTGEEPYMLAMVLLESFRDAKIDPGTWTLRILGTDVSADVLSEAERGEYRYLPDEPAMTAFNGLPDEYFAYFNKGRVLGNEKQPEHTLEVSERLKQLTHFKLHNLTSLNRPSRCEFDIILCQNVFMYIEEDARESIRSFLSDQLSPQGVLLIPPGS